MSTLQDGVMLGDAREWLRQRVDEGVHCPACTQFAKVYRRKLTAVTARVLIEMYRQGDEDGWVHMPTLPTEKGGDAIKARYWDLIEEMPERRDDGGRAGWWRLTNLGRSFVRGTVSIPRYARIYNGRCLSTQGEPTTIREALGTRFSYDELMAGV